MNFELRRHNIDAIKKILEDVDEKSISVNGIFLSGAVSIDIEELETYDADPDPELEYDGGRRELIELIFNFEGGGKASCCFCPDEEVCEISFETDNLWIINIMDMKKYLEREIINFQSRLEDYEEWSLL